MGNKQNKIDTFDEAIDKFDEHGVPEQKMIIKSETNLLKDRFIPFFTTKTSTVVYGYIRTEINNNQINKIIPNDLIDLIYSFIKNNCTFIIIFENEDPRHSYLHELDIESGTNKNLSINTNKQHHIWKRIPTASYCYGKYQNQTSIYRIGSKQNESIAYNIKTGKITVLPEIHRFYAQTIYSQNHGLFVIGGSKKQDTHNNGHNFNPYALMDDEDDDLTNYAEETAEVWRLNENENKWDKTAIPEMIQKRSGHLSVFYESHHYGISDKIYCLGGTQSKNSYNIGHIDPLFSNDESWLKGMECYDFGTGKWMNLGHKMYDMIHCGGCIDIETEKLIIAGGDRSAGKLVEEYDLEKNKWYQIGGPNCYTNYSHWLYPKVTKHNKVVVVFGNNGYSKSDKDYGYVEYLDLRENKRKWVVLSSLREMLGFDGEQVRCGFYQHLLQM